MQKTYQNPEYPYVRAGDLDRESTHYPVVIIGAGPCGLSAALDFAMQGIPTVVLDDNNTVSVGSRAICFSKRTLEMVDRYGAAYRMVNNGVTWKHGKVFFREELIYDFNLQPEEDHKLPAFINLQQYYFEEYLVDRCNEIDAIDLRWLHKVENVSTDDNGASISVDTQDGNYQLSCDYLLIADGANSPIRTQLGLESKGQVFEDRFLIADVVMQADFPTERWFWFDPPFHPNQSALLHKQADNVWRIDLQLGWDADPEEEKKEENIRPRIEAMLGPDTPFELEWASVYTFQCRKMDDYIHHRAFFIGDAAHQVSPFGARGANGGIQSVENLVWKIVRHMRGDAPYALIETYNDERQHGAAENILNSTRATDFITPKNAISRVFRDETLRLAKEHRFARALVNSGRLSLPCSYDDSALNSADEDNFMSEQKAGTVCKDAPIKFNGQEGWLLNQLGNRFVCMVNIDVPASEALTLASALETVKATHKDLELLLVSERETLPHAIAKLNCQLIHDSTGLVRERYDMLPQSCYLIRPDQVVAARYRECGPSHIKHALRRALGFELENA
jgi:3-(3-hydroxy-phenyl)propionate hydroxylase